jgi:prevent-host-death family protein
MFGFLKGWLGLASQASSAKPSAEPRAQYNVYDARNVFSHRLRRVRRGEEIVIAHAGEPVAKLIPVRAQPPTRPGMLRMHLLVNDGLGEEPRNDVTPTRSSPEAST